MNRMVRKSRGGWATYRQIKNTLLIMLGVFINIFLNVFGYPVGMSLIVLGLGDKILARLEDLNDE